MKAYPVPTHLISVSGEFARALIDQTRIVAGAAVQCANPYFTQETLNVLRLTAKSFEGLARFLYQHADELQKELVKG